MVFIADAPYLVMCCSVVVVVVVPTSCRRQDLSSERSHGDARRRDSGQRRDALLPLLSNVAVKALHRSEQIPAAAAAAAAAATPEIASRSDRVAAPA